MKKIIEHVYPYDDMYYDNCYFSALFPMIRYFGGSAIPFIVSGIQRYAQGPFRLEHDELFDGDKITADMGIKLERKRSDDIVGEIKEIIERGSLCMVFIDCFYEKLRPDAYNIHHWGHIILPYGYDDEEGVFHILEHDYVHGFMYQRYKMDYDQMRACYDGFAKKHDFDGLTIYSDGGGADVGAYQRKCLREYSEKLAETMPQLIAGIDELIQTLEGVASSGDCAPILDYNKEWFDSPAEMFAWLLKIKRKDQYLFQKAFRAPVALLEKWDKVLEGIGMLPQVVERPDKRGAYIKRIIAALELEKELWKEGAALADRSWRTELVQADVSGIRNAKLIGGSDGNISLGSYGHFAGGRYHFDGTDMLMPGPDDENDHVVALGQSIKVPLKKYVRLHVLGFGDYDVREQFALYSDGQSVGSADVRLFFTWTGRQIWHNDLRKGKMENMIVFHNNVFSLYGTYHYAVDLDGTPFDEIKLPDHPAMHIFAVTLESALPE